MAVGAGESLQQAPRAQHLVSASWRRSPVEAESFWTSNGIGKICRVDCIRESLYLWYVVNWRGFHILSWRLEGLQELKGTAQLVVEVVHGDRTRSLAVAQMTRDGWCVSVVSIECNLLLLPLHWSFTSTMCSLKSRRLQQYWVPFQKVRGPTPGLPVSDAYTVRRAPGPM